ncbi:hypothetical protein [Microcoleus sp. FACHB-672]|uniref:hypothetical protein n=1 Tax=Microcoleus sp. FACHB-672 TaxID=2692825 RepID=UPI0016821CA0|nr:hypothetical protein [Microcoleus sp. FACHB-672]MBD2043323.1 hypothetical protein [Microcoleus sp. FACHB-672]
MHSQHPGQRILLIWDGAAYHQGTEMQKFLEETNQVISLRTMACELYSIGPLRA